MSAEPIGPYRRRRVSALGLWSFEDWRVKVYGLTLHGGAPPSALVDQGREIARERLSRASREDLCRHGLAVLIVHEGENGDYVLVEWWSDNDILRHHNYGAPKGHGGRFVHQWPDPAACIWELAVVEFERAAWIRHVLEPAGGPDVAAYLDARLDALV